MNMDIKQMDKKIKIAEYEEILQDLNILSNLMSKSEQVKLALAVNEGNMAIQVINRLEERLVKHKDYLARCEKLVSINPHFNKALKKQAPVPMTPDEYRVKADADEAEQYAEEAQEPEHDGNPVPEQEQAQETQEEPVIDDSDVPKELKIKKPFPTGVNHPNYRTGRYTNITTSERPLPVPDTSKIPQKKPTNIVHKKEDDDDLMNEIDKMFLKGDENINELK